MINESRPLVLMADLKKVAEENRIRVQGRSNMTLLPDFFVIDVYNLSPEDRSVIDNAEIISVNGIDNSVFCYGEIEDIYVHPEETNEITTLVLSDGKKFWETVISRSVGAGAGVHDTIRNIMSNAAIGPILASDTRLVRGQVFVGRLAEAVSMMARSIKARAFITHGMVHITEKGRAEEVLTIPDNEIVDTPSQAGGIWLLRTKIKGYGVGTIAKMNGLEYRIVCQAIDADNYSGPWRSELTLVDEAMLSSYGMEGG